MPVLTVQFPIVVTQRTCSRCGAGFGDVGREHVCSYCRKPRLQERVRSQALSFREKQIVRLLQQAKANKEIAGALCLTEGTVKEYLHNIFQKLGVKNRTELALWGATNLRQDERQPPHQMV